MEFARRGGKHRLVAEGDDDAETLAAVINTNTLLRGGASRVAEAVFKGGAIGTKTMGIGVGQPRGLVPDDA